MQCFANTAMQLHFEQNCRLLMCLQKEAKAKWHHHDTEIARKKKQLELSFFDSTSTE